MKTPLYLALLLIISLSFPITHAETITIRSDSWFPYNGEPNSKNEGYFIDILKLIFKEHNITIDYQILPWKRSLVMTRRGDFDCVVGAYKSDAPDFIYPTQSLGKGGNVFYTLTESTWTYIDYSSFENQKIGLINAYAYDEDFDTFVSKSQDPIKFQYVSGDAPLQLNVNKLMNGRITSILEDPAVFSAATEEMGVAGRFKSAGSLGGLTDMYIACSPTKPSSSDLVKKIDAGIIQLRNSGKLNKILNKYGLSDWEK